MSLVACMDNPLFSIVIPYHACPKTVDFLRRQLNYYHFSTVAMIIILAISGDEQVIDEIKQFLRNINDSRFIYFLKDEKNIKNYRSFVEKIFDALKTVKTPYVVINGVDDLLIINSVEKGIEMLEKDSSIVAVKGHTIYFNYDSGNVLIYKDLGMDSDNLSERLNLAMQDRDSIFYIIRRTRDLVREYENILSLSRRSDIVEISPYHIEHFMALSVASLGKVCVFDFPWQMRGSHVNNHSSHTPASFLRVKLGAVKKDDYEWFRSLTQSISSMNYNRYKFLWICSQIRGISVSFRQVLYKFIHKECSLMDFICVSIYLVLNKIYFFLREFLPESYFGEKLELYKDSEEFFLKVFYSDLKKYYFSEENIKKIEGNRSKDGRY